MFVVKTQVVQYLCLVTVNPCIYMQQASPQISLLPPTVVWKHGFLILIVLGIEDAVSVAPDYFCVYVCRGRLTAQ